ncbi:hypothetical protein [Coleofasciculus sp.]|uniref:hypothetical protein n=1 Tax=Coleofasciculus sp. TaxID=3100458 RepID=UPI0040642FC2
MKSIRVNQLITLNTYLLSLLTIVLPKTAYAINLVVNSDFSAGNTGFYSDYKYNPHNLHPPAVYTVSINPRAVHTRWTAFGDHTTGSGNMMITNGSTTVGKIVWQQTLPVTLNTQYNFATWITSTFPNSFAQLQFAINSTPIGSLFTPSDIPGVWEQFSTTWNSESNSCATISIVNQNATFDGNDFALDDISFEAVSTATPIPEPASGLSLLAFGSLGIGSVLTRKKKR